MSKKMKRIVALMIAVVMVLTSITIDGYTSKADDKTANVNSIIISSLGDGVTLSESNTYSVSVTDNSGEVKAKNDSVKPEKMSDSDETLVLKLSGIGELATGAYKVSVSDSLVAGVKYVADINIDTNTSDYSIDKTDTYFGKVVLTLDKKYTNGTVTVTGYDTDKYVVDYDAALTTISFNNTDIKSGSSITISGTIGNTNYSGSVTVSSNNVTAASSNFKANSFTSVTIDLKDTYNNVVIKKGDVVLHEGYDKTSENSVTIKGSFNLDDELSITATGVSDGLAYAGSVEVNGESCSAELKATQYAITFTNTKIQLQYKKVDSSSFESLGGGTILDYGKGYIIQVTASNAGKLLSVTHDDKNALSYVSGSMDDKGIYTLTGTLKVDNAIDNNTYAITVSERPIAASDVNVNVTAPDKIVPEIPFTVSYTVTLKNDSSEQPKNLEEYFTNQKISVEYKRDEETTVTATSTGNENEYVLSGKLLTKYDDTKKASVNVTVSDRTDNTDKEVSGSREATLAVNDVSYSSDYAIVDSTVYSLDGKTVYYSGKNANVTFYKGNYSEYRIGTKSDITYTYGDFNKIEDNGTSETLKSSPTRFQMKNDATFGVSDEITLVADITEPNISISASGVNTYTDDNNKYYVVNESTPLSVTATDNEGGSGLKSIRYGTEQFKGDKSKIVNYGNEYTNGDAIKKYLSDFNDGKNTIYFYAIDNVGNYRERIVYVDKDTTGPTIEVTNFTEDEKKKINEDATIEEDTKTAYYQIDDLNEKGKGVTITISDEHLDTANTKIKKNDEEVSSDNTGTRMTYTFKPTEDGTYTFSVTASDTAGNIKTSDTYILVVDSEAPNISEAYAEPVSVNDEDRKFSEYADGYTAYNSSTKVEYSFTDGNPCKMTIEMVPFDGDKFEIEDDSFSETNGVWSGKYSFADGTNINGADNMELTIYDKAGNSTTTNVKRSNEEKPKNASNVYVKTNPVVFENDGLQFKKVANTQNYEITTNKDGERYITAKLTYKGTLINNFIKIYRGSYEIPNGDWNINIEKELTIKTTNWEDGLYNISIYYYDIADAAVDKIPGGDLIYDATSPVLTVTADEKKGIITYEVTDDNPNFSSFDVEATGSNNIQGSDKKITFNGKNQVADVNQIAEYLRNSGNWIKDENSNKYTCAIAFGTEGKYSVKVLAKDTTGNVSDEVSSSITYDNTAPAVITFVIGTEKSTSNTDYSKFDNKTVKVSVEAEELVSTEKITLNYKLVNPDGSTAKEASVDLSQQSGGKTFTGSFDVDPNFKGKISYTVTDDKKNTSDEATTAEGIVLESGTYHTAAASGISTTDTSRSSANVTSDGVYYKDAISWTTTIGDSYSGINNVAYSYIVDGKETAIGSQSFDTNAAIKTANTISGTVGGKEFEGEVHIKTVVTDNAGNKTEYMTDTRYILDYTKPVISVAYDNNSPSNDKYYNATRTATITINERNFANDRVSLSVKRDGAALAVSPSFHSTGSNTYVMTYSFADDGDYEFTVSCTDLAGNRADYTTVDTFTIDKTNPTMTISYDNNNAYSGAYYGESRTATIRVVEHNFDANGINVNVTASRDGASVSAPRVSGWTTNGDVHTATVAFNSDADYTISATSLDLAGNSGEQIAQQSFTVDLTAPVIEINGVSANESYTGSVLPIASVTDINYDADGVVVTLVGGRNGVVESGYATAAISHGQNFSFYDLEHVQAKDDIYTLTIRAVDRAGHETTESITFRVNRFGSIYSMSDALDSAVETYYAKASDGYAVYELNVDEVKSAMVSFTIDNDIVNLEEGTDYTVSHSEDKAGWNQYEYSFSEAAFEKEGIYTITVSSEDEVGNISDNKSKGVDMEFCIDNTAPVCIISGVEDGQEFERDVTAEIGIEAYDNIKFGTMKVELNGEEIKTEADLKDGKLSFAVAPTSDEQTLTVTCYDAAGNELVEEVHFTFDTSILQSHLWIIFVIIAICLILLGFIVIIAKRKKQANQ